MTRLAHISDLHFGAEDPSAVAELLFELNRKRPDLVVVSGDLTQRARSRQFLAAAEFLGEIESPLLVVPGNHDFPWHNLIRRFFRPLGRYREHISADLQPRRQVGRAAVVGINTARSMAFKGGRISALQVREAGEFLKAQPPEVCRVVATHHQFLAGEGNARDLVGRGRQALKVFRKAGVELILGGHCHRFESRPVGEYGWKDDWKAVVAHAGTATSTRLRGQPNSYNFITVEDESIHVEVRQRVSGPFRPAASASYPRAARPAASGAREKGQ